MSRSRKIARSPYPYRIPDRLTFEILVTLMADSLRVETAKIHTANKGHLTIKSVTTVTRSRNRVQIGKTRNGRSDDLTV